VRVNVEIKDQAVKGMLTDMSRRGENMRPVMREIGEIVRSSILRNFAEGGRPEKWVPTKILSIYLGYTMDRRYTTLSGEERIRKGKKAYTLKGSLTKAFQRHIGKKATLIDTGRLRNSITSRAYGDRVEIGTKVVYAAIHQFGGKAGRGRKVTIPARPYLMVQDEDWPQIRVKIIDYILGKNA